MNQTFLISLIGTLLLTGCATSKPIKYTNLGNNTTISVSSEQLSSMTESKAGDYFINGSQIIIGDANNAVSSPVSGMFGLIGVGIATAIDKKSNSSAISESTLNQTITFENLVHQKIDNALKINNIDHSIKLLSPNQISEIKVVPYAHLSFQNKPNVKITYGLKSQFKNAADNNSKTKRMYYYISLKKPPLNTWDKSNNALFTQTANDAFNALSQVLIMDIQHQLDINEFSPSKQQSCKKNSDSNYLQFIESKNDLCIGVIQFNNKTRQDMLYIVEQ